MFKPINVISHLQIKRVCELMFILNLMLAQLMSHAIYKYLLLNTVCFIRLYGKDKLLTSDHLKLHHSYTDSWQAVDV